MESLLHLFTIFSENKSNPPSSLSSRTYLHVVVVVVVVFVVVVVVVSVLHKWKLSEKVQSVTSSHKKLFWTKMRRKR